MFKKRHYVLIIRLLVIFNKREKLKAEIMVKIILLNVSTQTNINILMLKKRRLKNMFKVLEITN